MLNINYIELFGGLPPQLATLLVSIIPIAELRVSIPLAFISFHLPLWQAISISVIGNMIIAAAIINFINPVYNLLKGRFSWLDKFFSWIFTRTRNKFSHKYKIWGNIALMLFVAIPLPVTGVWTGSLASWLFGIPKKRALFFITLGAIISAGIVTIITIGAINIIN